MEPNDPLFPEQDFIFGGQWGMRKIQAPQAWQGTGGATGAGIKVAVLDTGLDIEGPEEDPGVHEDFACANKVEVIANSDFVDDPNGPLAGPHDGNGHGTHVAGIVGACTNNGKGVVGVAPDATIMPIQVLDAVGDGFVTTVAPAIRAAADAGAHVVNMSLGGSDALSVIEVFDEAFPEVNDAIEYAQSKGVVVVAAAGNQGFPLCGYPAIIDDIICVGATDPRDNKSWYSNFPVQDTESDFTGGPAVVAPGGTGQVFCDFHAEEIVSTYARAQDGCDEGYHGYRALNGTSMASPHVAGVAALVYDRLGGARSAANAATVIDSIISTADDLYAPGYDPASGYGRVNALRAVQAVESPDPTPSPTPTVQDTSISFVGTPPASGQFTDSISVSGKLTEADGDPIANEEITFQLLGPNGFREANAVTDETGVAGITLELDAAPGSYDLIVGYSGKTNTYNSSSASVPFELAKEDSAATLTVTGKGSDKTFEARVFDADDSSYPVSRGLVSFFAGSEHLGDAITNDEGTATLTAKVKGAKKTTYRVDYIGSDYFLPTSGAA